MIVLLLVLGITYIIWVSDGIREGNYNADSKSNAKRKNAMFYKEKRGGKQYLKSVSNGQKAYECLGVIYDTKTSKPIINIEEYEISERQKWVKNYCKNEGYPFYPLVTSFKNKRKYGYADILFEMESNQPITIRQIGYGVNKGKVIKTLMREKSNGGYEFVPAQKDSKYLYISKMEDWKYDYDINLRMRIIVDKSLDWIKPVM